MSVLVPVIDHIDGEARRIYLKVGVTSYHPVDDIYKEVRNMRASDTELQKYYNFVSAGGNVKKLADGSRRTERYAIFHDTKVVPWDANHDLAVLGEQLYSDTVDGGPIASGSACIDKTLLSTGVDVNVDYAPAKAEVIVVSTGSAVTAQDKTDIIQGTKTAILSTESFP